MYLYQKNRTYFAQIADGFEAIARNELESLGATQIKTAFRGLHFQADPAGLYRINYQSRLVSRVLAPLVAFKCEDRSALYQKAKSIDWSRFFALEQTFGIFSNVSGNDKLRHSKFAALCVKDAIADQFRERCGQRPNVDKTDPDVWVHLLVNKKRAVISLDTSGGSLHKRGYRKESVTAPMKETLAAAMVALSGWQGDRPLYDPMCGSGTLLCEALLTAGRIPAGRLRSFFGFQNLPDFDAPLWQKVKSEADAGIQPVAKGMVSGSDIAQRAVRAARANCKSLPGGNSAEIHCQDYTKIGSIQDTVIVCNPPYGLRLSSDQDLGAFYKTLGDFLKQRCTGSQAYLYFGNREMIKKIGLKPAWKKPMRNAGLDGSVVKYELY